MPSLKFKSLNLMQSKYYYVYCLRNFKNIKPLFINAKLAVIQERILESLTKVYPSIKSKFIIDAIEQRRHLEIDDLIVSIEMLLIYQTKLQKIAHWQQTLKIIAARKIDSNLYDLYLQFDKLHLTVTVTKSQDEFIYLGSDYPLENQDFKVVVLDKINNYLNVTFTRALPVQRY